MKFCNLPVLLINGIIKIKKKLISFLITPELEEYKMSDTVPPNLNQDASKAAEIEATKNQALATKAAEIEATKNQALATKAAEIEATKNQALAMSAEKNAYISTIQEVMQTVLNIRSNVNFLQLKLNEANATIDLLKKQLADAKSATPKASEEKSN